MESLIAILAAVCLALEFAGKRKLSGWLFAVTLLITAFTFHLHTTSALKLEF